MTIKSDQWVRRMARQHGMIEPFEPVQVRTAADGQRIVSYGTSSYGYDVRCAPEFKVFTNINSTVVDPKNFDENSFVDINKDVCVIPPNSAGRSLTRSCALKPAMCVRKEFGVEGITSVENKRWPPRSISQRSRRGPSRMFPSVRSSLAIN